MKLLSKLHDIFFQQIHGRRLIYNTCWEDPRIDRQLLEIDDNSKIIVITSAGCNTLDYVLDAPAEIHAIDVNPRQNAVLQLKIKLIERGRYDDLYAMFGEGKHPNYQTVYEEIRPELPDYAQEFWDRNIRYFNPKNRVRRTFYFQGAVGDVALLNKFILMFRPKLRRSLLKLFEAESIEEQKILLEDLDKAFWTPLVRWIVNRTSIMALIGVPQPQIDLALQQSGSMSQYIRDRLKQVVTSVSMRDNYFWRVYLTGNYTPDCCPNYLKRKNFEALREHVHRIQIHTMTMADFLKTHPDNYTDYVLLDHQDWLAWHDPEALDEEWQLILKNSQKGTRILMRSADGPQLSFLPDLVQDTLRFYPDITEPIHLQDRVGTYESLHLAEVL